MAFTGLFKTPAQIAAEERAEQFKGTSGWEAVGVGLRRLFSGPSDAELRTIELDKAGDELIEFYNANAETGSWDDLSYTEQLGLGEKFLRKKGFGIEADALFDERVKRRTFERAEAEEARKARKELAGKGAGKGPSAAQFGGSIEEVGKWMESAKKSIPTGFWQGTPDWNINQTTKVEAAFGILQQIPGLTATQASTILRSPSLGFIEKDSDKISTPE